MAQRIQSPGNKTKNQTEGRTPLLYKTTFIRGNNGSYRNCNAVSFGWRCNIFTCCAAFGNIFDDDKGKSYDILEGGFSTMKQLYVLCNRDCGTNRLVYYTGKESFHGSLYFGNVLEAKKFESLQEVANLIAQPSDTFYLGINIIGIADVTFEKLKESKETDRILYDKFHDPNYAIR